MRRACNITWSMLLSAAMVSGCAGPATVAWENAPLAATAVAPTAVAHGVEQVAHVEATHYQPVVIEPQEEIPPPALLPAGPDSLPRTGEARPPAAGDLVADLAADVDQGIRPIGQLSTDISVPATLDQTGSPVDLPPDYARTALAQHAPYTRGTPLDPAAYAALPYAPELEFCYQPLFFEEVNVERYGRSLGLLQPAVSIVQFYGRMPALPYMMVARKARTCSYHAHWTLPGYKAPYERPEPIVRADAGLAETAFVYGMILIIP